MENKAKKLLNKVGKLINENEYNLVKLNGVKCSHSDLETIEMVLKYFINHGDFGNFMIYGEVRNVLSKEGIL